MIALLHHLVLLIGHHHANRAMLEARQGFATFWSPFLLHVAGLIQHHHAHHAWVEMRHMIWLLRNGYGL